MIEVIVGLGQVQEPVQIEIGLDAISAGNRLSNIKNRKRNRTDTTNE